jgi:ParB/RepB/Spo0J family partition protein
VKRRLKEITPNIHNEKLFDSTDESLAELGRDIERNGLRCPIRITKVGAVIIDGERRWRVCKKLGWTLIDVVEEDVHRNEILGLLIDTVSQQRHMTLIEQARVYATYYNHLKRAHRKGDLNHIAAKQIALEKARLPFRSVALADQLVQVVDRGHPDLHEKLLRGEMSITGAYEAILRRLYKPMKYELLPRPERTLEQLARAKRHEDERLERQEELEFTQTYIDAHLDDLESVEAQRRLLGLFEPDPPPAALKYRDNPESQVIAEAFESLAVKEPPELLVGRLTMFIEEIAASVQGVDESRARDIVRDVVKPMVLRLAQAFPRQEFEVPVNRE